jgi:hypothetical protein
VEHPLEKPTDSPARETGPPDPDFPPPSADAELYVYLESRGEQPAEAPGMESTHQGLIKKLGPFTARFRMKMPGTASEHMLGTIERISLGVTWAGTVIGTFYAAGAAHLSPEGTLTVVVLEILVPPVLFRTRKRPREDRSDRAIELATMRLLGGRHYQDPANTDEG